MKRALIRFEDVGPGGPYSTQEGLLKLKAMADYLNSEKVPFHISLISRFVNPVIWYDKSIEQISDPYITLFNNTLKCIDSCYGASLGMHGYTHQYFRSESAAGYEFYYSSCSQNCPPNDSPEALSDRDAFLNSYASSRMLQGYRAYQGSGLTLDWGYSTPHYSADEIQRCILESWSGIFFQPDPLNSTSRRISIRDTDMPFYRGVIYVPTPLAYVKASDPDVDIERICEEIKNYTEEDVAAFYYHPYLEFPFIEITPAGIVYDDNSYLKRLIRCFKEDGFTFVPLLSLVSFIPSGRITNFFPGKENVFFVGKCKDKMGLIIWQPNTGTWYYTTGNVENFPSRQVNNDIFSTNMVVSNWAVGDYWKPLIGDFNGDGNDDVVAWNPQNGDWQVALYDGLRLNPKASWLKPWAVGNYWVPLVGDFNGNGIDDLVVWNPNTGDWQVALSDGTKFNPKASWLKAWGVGDYLVPLVGDFNGDGIDDLVVWNPDTGDWQVALSDGTKFNPKASWLRTWAVGNYWTPLVGDFDGDGKTDILVVDVSRGDWQVALSTGSQFRPYGRVLQPWAADSEMQPFVADFNGDGKMGIIARHPTLRNGTLDGAASVIQKSLL
ncbi:DUF2334 domain-containing protein [Crassaminicella profunda]|uniref:DUF2334 domain-containing protein n=1 Tax=Crassaminicella profunda TaxID=1286698 RepID=UPI001CA79DF2|nr:DUF2334 domain-containing protein [Crassaminicella profunda]QZY57030.1 DUF2334 domain-containing protein [Crassaminicella profunda]